MTADPIQSAYHPRRTDREVRDEDWIRSFLHQGAYGTLATVDGSQPYLTALLYAFDPALHALFLHTSDEGRAARCLTNNPLVCFGVHELGRLLPAKLARGFGVEYSGVVVFGRAHIVPPGAAAQHGLQLLLDKYFAKYVADQDYQSIQPEDMAHTAVIRLNVEHWSGKRNLAAPDYPGAFSWGVELR